MLVPLLIPLCIPLLLLLVLRRPTLSKPHARKLDNIESRMIKEIEEMTPLLDEVKLGITEQEAQHEDGDQSFEESKESSPAAADYVSTLLSKENSLDVKGDMRNGESDQDGKKSGYSQPEAHKDWPALSPSKISIKPQPEPQKSDSRNRSKNTKGSNHEINTRQSSLPQSTGPSATKPAAFPNVRQLSPHIPMSLTYPHTAGRGRQGLR